MKKIILIIAFLPLLYACKKGCTDSNATNYDYDAKKDDKSCEYSIVTFYAKYSYYNSIPITKVDISVDGNMIGSATAFFPNGPGNCSATGTVSYNFQSGKSVDWNSTIYLSSGATLLGSGTVSPNSSLECIKVCVTN
ncbi:MAG: hypothetical protein A2033_02445 [Bacteroidetes bacterium GWA2_31_9]|nr:MAG: hypothetical protein A2033_02445 [Bacteroidetes bacterium GWA2_31_9]